MTLRTRAGSALAFDAYFPDEAGLTYLNSAKAGARLNKFTRIFVPGRPTPVEISQAEAIRRRIDPDDQTRIEHLQPGTVRTDSSNPLDPSISASLPFPENNIPTTALGHNAGYTAFAPPRLIAELADLSAGNKQLPRPIRISILFGTGSEMGRHGLRAFIDRASWRMLVTVPGVEPTYDFAAGHRWGIGIDTSQLTQLVTACFGRAVPFVVDRLAGFSTGYIGVTGTIRNRLIDLRNVEVYALFDCNYGEARVVDGIRVLKQLTANRVKIIAYASSLAGTPKANERRISLDVSPGGTAWLFGRPDFQALTHARMLASGLADQTVDPAEIDSTIRTPITNLFAALPSRGSVVSEPSIHQLIHGQGPASTTTTLAAWYQANRAGADLFLKALWAKTGTSSELVRLIWKHQLPGWPGLGPGVGTADTAPARAFTEGAHDFVPFEFGWEVLA